MQETLEERSEDYEFSFIAGNYAVDFANTISSYRTTNPTDHIGNYADLTAWGVEAGLIGEVDRQQLLAKAARNGDKAVWVLKRAHRLRTAVYRIFGAVETQQEPRRDDLETLNAELGNALAQARLEKDEGKEYTWGWSGLEGALDGMLWPVARAAAELLTSEQKEKVRACASDTCGWLFIDKSRNHSRQWCDMRDCGNRAKARRHYHRTRGAE